MQSFALGSAWSKLRRACSPGVSDLFTAKESGVPAAAVEVLRSQM